MQHIQFILYRVEFPPHLWDNVLLFIHYVRMHTMMDSINALIDTVNGYLYGYVLIALLVLGGLYFTARLQFLPTNQKGQTLLYKLYCICLIVGSGIW